MKIGWLVFLFLGVFWLVGVWLLGRGLWAARRSTQAAAWPTAPATLTRAELAEENVEGSTNTDPRSSASAPAHLLKFATSAPFHASRKV